MRDRYKSISENPSKDGRYLVNFYNPYMHETDRTELAWRGFYNGEWDNPTYNFKGDGYKLIGWYENEDEQ